MAKVDYKGETLADSKDTEEVEGNLYFPPESVNKKMLKVSETQYTCPWKGKAEYYNLEINGKEVGDIAWSYPDPKEAAKNIKGFISFDTSKVEVSN